MWDNAILLRKSANALIVFSVLAVAGNKNSSSRLLPRPLAGED